MFPEHSLFLGLCLVVAPAGTFSSDRPLNRGLVPYPPRPPQLPYSRLKDTWMKISLVTKEVDELGAIIKIACRQGVQVALYL